MQKEENTNKNKSSISNGTSYEEMGEFWDEHDTTEYWEQTYPVDFEVELEDNQSLIYYGIDNSLSQKIFSLAEKKGLPPRDLVNLWLEEKLKEDQKI